MTSISQDLEQLQQRAAVKWFSLQSAPVRALWQHMRMTSTTDLANYCRTVDEVREHVLVKLTSWAMSRMIVLVSRQCCVGLNQRL